MAIENRFDYIGFQVVKVSESTGEQEDESGWFKSWCRFVPYHLGHNHSPRKTGVNWSIVRQRLLLIGCALASLSQLVLVG